MWKNNASKKKLYIGFIAVGVLLTLWIGFNYLWFYYSKSVETMRGSLSFWAEEYDFDVDERDTFDSLKRNFETDITRFCAYSFTQNKYTTQMLVNLNSDIDYASVYYVERVSDETIENKKFVVHKAGDAIDANIDAEVMEAIVAEGQAKLSDGRIVYGAATVPGSYVIVAFDDTQLQSEEYDYSTAVSSYGETTVLFNPNEKGDILLASDENIKSLTMTELLTAETYHQLLEQIGEVNIHVINGKTSLLLCEETDSEYAIACYIPFHKIIVKLIRSIIVPITLFWIIAILGLGYVTKLADENVNERKTSVHIAGKIYIDRKINSHLLALTLFSIIVVLFILIYIQTLNRYSEQSVKAAGNLEMAAQDVTYCNNAADTEISYLNKNSSRLINLISNYYMRYPEQLNNQSIEKISNILVDVEEINIYDTTGTIRFSNNGAYIGYTLSSDVEDRGVYGRDILDGKQSSYGTVYDGFYYAYGRRQDTAGVVGLRMKADNLIHFIEICRVENVIDNDTFGDADGGYIDMNEPTVMYWSKENSQGFGEITGFPEEILQSGYSGSVRINGSRYYVNTLLKGDYLYVSALYVGQVIGFDLSRFWIGILAAFLALHLLYLSVVINTEKPDTEIEKITPIPHISHLRDLDIEEQILDDGFMQTMVRMFLVTGIMLLAYLGLDMITNKESLLSYLLSTQWNKGLNLFSLTMILILIVGAALAIYIIKNIIIFFTKNMGPKGMTIGRMISSLMQLIVLIFVVIKTMVYLGVNPTALVAGAGVVGAMISFCAQNTVNDMLSGFFIVFEGLFSIGDWIQVGDWRGQVVEISVRTTKVSIGGSVKVFCNSELKQVTLLSKNFCGALVNIGIAYREDVDEVIDLIHQNLDSMREQIPSIVDGPYIDGITALGESSVTIRMWALTTPDAEMSVERDLRRIIKKLFNENGVEIPFPQITINTPLEQQKESKE